MEKRVHSVPLVVVSYNSYIPSEIYGGIFENGASFSILRLPCGQQGVVFGWTAESLTPNNYLVRGIVFVAILP